MFISVFNYVYLKGCHPLEMQGCWHEGRLVKLLTFCLQGRKFDQSSFVGISFISFNKMAEGLAQHISNCVYKTQTATTGTRPASIAEIFICMVK